MSAGLWESFCAWLSAELKVRRLHFMHLHSARAEMPFLLPRASQRDLVPHQSQHMKRVTTSSFLPTLLLKCIDRFLLLGLCEFYPSLD